MDNHKITKIVAISIVSAFTCVIVLSFWLFWDFPKIKNLSLNRSIPSIRITDRHGINLYEVIDKKGGRHTPVTLDEIPTNLLLATIATEDQSFYSNPGIDFSGMLRALWINLKGGETLAGGSTITQQVTKNLLLPENEQFERTLRRKLREIILAWRLTNTFSKDEILGLYLNQIYYGALTYGVEAAAQTYFGKSVSQLDLAECALLAGLPQGPAIYNPLVDPEAAKKRQEVVLQIMFNQGFISSQELDLAALQPLIYTTQPYPIEAPHFVMMVIAQLDTIIPLADRPKDQSLIVKTTLDLNWQHFAEEAITHHLQALRQTDPKLPGVVGSGHNVPGGHNVNNAAVVAINPITGEILSFVGNHDYFDSNHNGAINMALALRQPGSSLKPLVYAAAFDPSHQFPMTAGTMILDVSTTFQTHEGDAYTPANYDNMEHGPVSARQALASSLNIPAVITLNSVGLQNLFDLARKMGITSFGNPDNYDLSLALGGGDVSLLELTTAYGVLANKGLQLSPYAIESITTFDEEILYHHKKTPSKRVVDERVAWLISDILNDNDARTIGFGLNSALKLDRKASVKTGTTTNYHDNWTIGYTPDLVVGVWVGNANHEPMRGVSGLSGAGPIWHQFIREVLAGMPESWYPIPSGMAEVKICALSGMLPTESCPFTRYEWFIKGTEPQEPDSIYHKIWLDSNFQLINNENTNQNHIEVTVLDLPVQAHHWAREAGILLLSDFIHPSLYNQTNFSTIALQIISPGDQTLLWLNHNFDLNSQRLHIEATSSELMSVVELWVDNLLVASFSEKPYEFWWQLEQGNHTIQAKGRTMGGQSLISSEIAISVESSK